jgi:deoxyadenosine/deoxycytidine kinase
MHRLQIRGRSYEKEVTLDYLSRLNKRYDEWAHSFRRAPLLKLDTDDLDFVRYLSDLERILNLIEEALFAQESAALFP